MTKRGYFFLAGVAILFLVVVVICWPRGKAGDETQPDPELDMPYAYAYSTVTAMNGTVLHYLLIRPSNLSLQMINDNVTLAPYYGINGGFFYEKSLLSMAVVNDVPVGSSEPIGGVMPFGVGAENVKYARGTLVWDGATDKLSVQVVRQASELRVSDRSRYWAQGGISMGLALGDRWKEQALLENVPFPDDGHLRSAAVYDTSGNLYLVVSSTLGTLESFRQAILEKIGIGGTLEDGIFLDGDGSSQLRSREAKLLGDSRPVVEMMRIVK